MATGQKITTYLWFDGNAEEAVDFYTSVFPDARPLKKARYGDAGPGPKGTVVTASFELFGQEFVALNGGPEFGFTEAISLCVNCETQEEVDYYWEKLSAGGEESMCGWLKDRFGLSWQIVPTAYFKMAEDEDPEKADRVVAAMLKMTKLDIAKLERAFEG